MFFIFIFYLFEDILNTEDFISPTFLLYLHCNNAKLINN